MSDVKYYPFYHAAPLPGTNNATTWINDPEGAVWDDNAKLYRAWAIYRPTMEGNLFASSWLEFTSPDGVIWTAGDVRLSNKEYNGGGIWGGSVIIDKHNTAGFGKNAAIYLVSAAMNEPDTAYPNLQCVSRWVAPRLGVQPDFVDYPIQNPNDSSVDEFKDFRDSRVFWDEKAERWVLAISISYGIEFYGSPDTKNWKRLSTWIPSNRTYGQFGGVECPNLVYMPVDQNQSDGFSAGDDQRPTGRWVLFFSDQVTSPERVCAVVGEWNGTSFIQDSDDNVMTLDYGVDHYAQSIYTHNGETFMISWLGHWAYAITSPMEGYRNYLTLVRKLTLRRRGGWYDVHCTPLPGQDNIFKNKPLYTAPTRRIGGKHHTFPLRHIKTPTAFKLKLRLSAHNGRWPSNINLNLRTDDKDTGHTQLFLLANQGIAESYRHQSGVTPPDGHAEWEQPGRAPVDFSTGHLDLVAYVDSASVEYFFQDNDVSITTQMFPNESSFGIALTASEDGECSVDELSIYPLKDKIIQQHQNIINQ